MQNYSYLRDFILKNSHLGSVYLATLYAKQGTTFAAVGSKMAFNEAGAYVGLLSGGCFERDLIEHGLAMPNDQLRTLVHYNLDQKEDLIFGTGSGCPGRVSVLIEKIQGEYNQDFLALISDESRPMKAFVKCSDMDSPHKPFKVFDLEQRASIGHQQGDFFSDYSPAQPALTIIGGRDISLSLARFAKNMGWFVRYVTDQNQLGPQEASVAFDSFNFLPSLTTLSDLKAELEGSFVVILAHNFFKDVEVLDLIKLWSLPYLGLLGSQKRFARIEEALGFKYPRAIHCPVGLKLGGRSPQDIALSVIAQLQQEYNNRNIQSDRKNNEERS